MRDPVRIFVRPELSEAALLLAFDGWNDAGQAATTAVQFIGRSIRSVPLAEIDCEDFLDFTVTRPDVFFDADGRRQIDWPHTRIRYGAIDPARELAVGTGVEPHTRWRTYCDAVSAVVRSFGIRRVVLLGAYLADVVYSRPVGVTGLATRAEALDEIGVARSEYEGPTGIVGVLMDVLSRQGAEVVSLWAGLPHYISASPNPRGALALVQKAMALLDFKLDADALEREAAEFEQKISDLVASDPELGEYVRQLKKREFAQ